MYIYCILQINEKWAIYLKTKKRTPNLIELKFDNVEWFKQLGRFIREQQSQFISKPLLVEVASAQP